MTVSHSVYMATLVLSTMSTAPASSTKAMGIKFAAQGKPGGIGAEQAEFVQMFVHCCAAHSPYCCVRQNAWHMVEL